MSSLQGPEVLRLGVLTLLSVGLPVTGHLSPGQEPTADKASTDDVQRFLNHLETGNRMMRYKALNQLGRNDKDGVPLILDAVKSSGEGARRDILSALRRIGAGAVPHLVEAANHRSDPKVRLTAIVALGSVPSAPEKTVPCLIGALPDDDPEIRRASIRSMGRFGKAAKPALPRLTAMATEDPDEEVRIAAAEVLGQLHLQPEVSVPALLQALSDERARVRKASAVALGRLRSDARPALVALSRATGDEDKNVRMSAIRAVASVGQNAPESMPSLLMCLVDQDPQISELASVSIRRASLSVDPSVDFLLAATKAVPPHVRRNAVSVLGTADAHSKQVAIRLIELLEDKDETVLRAALAALADLPQDATESITPIIEATKSKSPVVQGLAEEALRNLAPEQAKELIGKRFDAVQARRDAIKDLEVGKDDWPQLGGSRLRNNTPAGSNIPTAWNPGKHDRRTGEWNLDEAFNIKWMAKLGSQSYGNPVAANGKIYVGTNNAAGYLKRYPSRVDLGCLLCFRESDGEFLWQHSSEKLVTGRVHDWPLQGICSSPVIQGDRLWFVTNRGEVVCLDAEGFYDNEDDGPEKGVWSLLFEAVADLETGGKLASRRQGRHYTNTVRALIASADQEIPPYIYVHNDPTTNGWMVVTSGRRDSNPLYRLGFEKNLLRISSAQDETSETLEFRTDLLSGMSESTLSPALRAQFLESGTELPEQVAVTVVEPQKQWELVAMVDGKQRRFRLTADGQKLICRAQITPPELKREADVVWKFDMMKELGVSQHNMATCGPALWGDVLFICTSNGLDASHINLPSPEAPSFMAMDKNRGEVLWTDNSPGKNILHGQWSCPTVGVFDGVPQVIFPGGDGWLYAFRADRWENGRPEFLWKFDCNPKESKWILGGQGTRNNIIAVPVIYDGLVYAAVGQDPEHGEGRGHLWCIDPTKRGDVSPELAMKIEGDHRVPIAHKRVQAVEPEKGEVAVDNPNSAVVWHYDEYDQNGDGEIDFEEEFHRTISSPTIKNDLLVITDFSGIVHCLHAKTGIPYWSADLLAQCWSTPLVVEDKIYVGDEDGEIAIFALSPDASASVDDEMFPSNEIYMGTSVYQTPIVVNDVLYVGTKNRLFAIETESQ